MPELSLSPGAPATNAAEAPPTTTVASPDGLPSASEIREALEAQQAEGAKPPEDKDKKPDTPPPKETPADEKPKGEDEKPPESEEEPEKPDISDEDLKNPAIAKRIGELEAGYQKVVDFYKSESEAIKGIQELMPKFERIVAYQDAIEESPEKAGQAVLEILQTAAAFHKVPIETLFKAIGAPSPSGQPAGPPPGAPAATDLLSAENLSKIIDNETDIEFVQKIGPLLLQQARASIMAELGATPEQIKALVAEKSQATHKASQESETNTFVAQQLPAVAGHFKTNFHGFEVTAGMLASAVSEFPKLKGTPVEAVKKAFVTQLVDHVQKAVAKRATTVPEGLDGSDSPGVAGVKDLDEITPASIRKARAAQQA